MTGSSFRCGGDPSLISRSSHYGVVSCGCAVVERKLKLQRPYDMIPSDKPTSTIRARLGSDESVAIAVLAVLVALWFLPLLLAPTPATPDYPNHLARMYS